MTDKLMEKYLGDGVYAYFKGYAIKICADRDCQHHAIYLDHAVMLALFNFAKQCGWEMPKS